jgi:ATP-binding cassette, subfamily C (CFTR/MRP), member 1
VSIAISGISIASLILWTKNPITRISVPAAALDLVGALSIVALLGFEHVRNVRPSTVLLLYVFASIFAQAVEIRTLYIRGYVIQIARLTCGSLACRVLLLVLECRSKVSHLKVNKDDYSPEEFSSIFSRSTFWWLNPILWLGNRQILSIQDLYPLNRALNSKDLQTRILYFWGKRI